jgi:integrase
MVTIGRFGTLTPDQARKEAKRILGGVAVGNDPAAELEAKRREITMSALIDLYEGKGCVIQRGKRQGTPMKPRTKAYTMSRLRHHVLPLLGAKRASTINAGDIEAFVADVTAGKSACDRVIGPRKRIIVRGGAGAARKVVRDLSAVFSFAKRSEIVSRNPCETAAIRRTDGKTARFLTLEEVARFGEALDALEVEGVNPKALNIARLWALTGCRRNEILELKWSEVNFAEGLLELADSKTGRSIRPLGTAAAVLLKSIPKQEGSDFVFPAERGEGHFVGTKSLWSRIREKAKLPDVTPHTLRHTMGSTAISTGEALALTGAILGHSNPRSTAIYAHVQHDPSKRAANRVTKRIAAALAGKPTGPKEPKPAKHRKHSSDGDAELIRMLTRCLAEEGPEAERLRQAIGQSVGIAQQASEAGEPSSSTQRRTVRRPT